MASPQRDSSHPREIDVARTLSRWLIPLLLIGVALAAWHNSFDGAFLLDDQPRIVDNVQIRKLWPLSDVMAQSSRPFLQVALAVNYALGGSDPSGYHALNLAVHILAGLVLYGLVRRMLESDRMRARYAAAAPWLAMAVAGIWLVHPLQTAGVTYIIQRAESLMGLFYLLTIYCGARAAHSPLPWRWSFAAVVVCALGMGTKEVMVTAPLAMLLYDRVFIAESFRDVFRARWGLYAGLACTWFVLAAALMTNRTEEQTFMVAGLDPWRYALTQCEVIVHYLRLALWPHPLVFDYGWPLAASLTAVLPSEAALFLLFAGTLVALWKRMWAGFWGAWFFLILAPTSSIMPIADVAFEHRMYLPLAAVVAVVAIGAYELLGLVVRRTGTSENVRVWLGTALLGGVIVALGFTTARRNDDYRSAIAMWTDTVAKRPDNARAHNNLGVAFAKQGRARESLAQYAEAARLKPDYVDARNNLGSALFKDGRTEEAIVEFREAVRVRPTFADAHNNLGVALAKAGRNEEAIIHYARAASLNPDSAQIHNSLGSALYLQGRIKEAVVQYTAAIRLQPGLAEAHYNLALAVLEQSDTEQAVAQFSEAIRLKPDYSKAHNNLAILLHRQGRTKEAIAHFSEAIRLDPAFAEARKNLQAVQGSRPERAP